MWNIFSKKTSALRKTLKTDEGEVTDLIEGNA